MAEPLCQLVRRLAKWQTPLRKGLGTIVAEVIHVPLADVVPDDPGRFRLPGIRSIEGRTFAAGRPRSIGGGALPERGTSLLGRFRAGQQDLGCRRLGRV